MAEPDTAARKRRRGAAPRSCAECRRLKLRCDRTIPCSSCVKRGCGAICPDGSLTTGQGNRFVLASTEELHEKIASLSFRVRALEDALRVAHSKVSTTTHPLLGSALLQLKAPLQRERPETPPPDSPKELPSSNLPDEFIKAAGTLAIRPAGSANYFGQSAGSWYFMQNEEDTDDVPDERAEALRRILDPTILEISGSCWFSSMRGCMSKGPGGDGIIQTILSSLPPPSQAQHMVDMYWEYGSWQVLAITKEQFNEEVYKQYYGSEFHFSLKDYALFHRLAILLMVFAVGCAVDPGLAPYNIEAERWFHLARAAMSRSYPIDQPTTSAIQCLLLMHHYIMLANNHVSSYDPQRWALLGLTVRLSQAIGLHRDCRLFNLSSKETLQRQILFWEVTAAEAFMAVVTGRPSSISLSSVDIPLPFAADNCPPEYEYAATYHRWVLKVIKKLHDESFGAKLPEYNIVIQHDHLLRSFPVPPMFRATPRNGEDSENDFSGTVTYRMQRFSILVHRELVLLYLHRAYFACAMFHHAEDPVASPFGTSFLAAYRSASTAVSCLRDLVNHLPNAHPISRMWLPWTQFLSCAVVLGSIASRCPSQPMAPTAVAHLDTLCELLAPFAPVFKAQQVLETTRALRDKARRSVAEFRTRMSQPIPVKIASCAPEAYENDELYKFGATTRVICRSPLQSRGSPSSSSSEPSPPTQSESLSAAPAPQYTPDAQSFTEYFNPSMASTVAQGSSRSLDGYGVFAQQGYAIPVEGQAGGSARSTVQVIPGMTMTDRSQQQSFTTSSYGNFNFAQDAPMNLHTIGAEGYGLQLDNTLWTDLVAMELSFDQFSS